MAYRTQLAIAVGCLVLVAFGAWRLRTHYTDETPVEVTKSSAEEAKATAADVSSARLPSAPLPSSPDAVPALATDRQKLTVLDEILASKNDNDPRLDLSFRDLTPAAKELFRERYRSLAKEKFNERGTVVYLLGREIKSETDAAFVRGVLAEKPCAGMKSCVTVEKTDPEAQSVNDVTRAYPQMVALKSMERYLKRTDRDPAIAKTFSEAVQKAKTSLSEPVARLARRLATNP